MKAIRELTAVSATAFSVLALAKAHHGWPPFSRSLDRSAVLANGSGRGRLATALLRAQGQRLTLPSAKAADDGCCTKASRTAAEPTAMAVATRQATMNDRMIFPLLPCHQAGSE